MRLPRFPCFVKVPLIAYSLVQNTVVGVGVNIFNDECTGEYMNVPILETSLKS